MNLNVVRKLALRRFLIFFVVVSNIPSFGYGQFINPVAPPQTTESMPPAQPIQTDNMCIPLQFQLPKLDTLENFLCPYMSGHADIDHVPILGTVSFDYELWRSPHFDLLQLNNDVLSVASTLYYYARFSRPVSAQCGWQDEDTQQLTIGFDAKIGIDSDYSLKAIVQPRTVINPTQCKLTLADLNATPTINKFVYQYIGAGGDYFNKRLKTLSFFKNKINDVWITLQTPVQLTNDSWLVITPKALSYGPITSTHDAAPIVSMNLDVSYSAQVVYGAPPAPSVVPLPSLISRDCNNSQLSFQNEISLPFSSQVQQLMPLTQAPNSNSFIVGRRKLTVNSINIYNSNRKTVLSFSTRLTAVKQQTGFKVWNWIRYQFERIFYKHTAILYAEGSPIFQKDSYSLTNLKFETNTQALINKKAAWIASSDLLKAVYQNSQIDLRQRLANIKGQIDSKFNGHLTPFYDILSQSHVMDFTNVYNSANATVLRFNQKLTFSIKFH